METKSVKVVKLRSGRMIARIVVYTSGGNEADYKIHNDRDSEGVSHYWYEVDGHRVDLTPHEVKALWKAVREVKDDG